MGLDHALLCVACFVLNMVYDMCGDCVIACYELRGYIHSELYIGKDEHNG